MIVRRSLVSWGLTVVLIAPLAAHAAADLDFKEFRLRHVCKGGATPGAVCCAADECGTGRCIVDAVGKMGGVLTLVVDDEVTGLDGSDVAPRRVRALTTILELKGRRGPALAQTFQNLDPADLGRLLDSLESGPSDEFGFLVTEGPVTTFIDPSDLGAPLDVSFLVYRTLDPDTLRELRIGAGLAPDGPELFVIQPQRLKVQRFVDRYTPSVPGDPDSLDTDPFASLLRVRMSGYFVAPAPPACP